jgi:putative transposase
MQKAHKIRLNPTAEQRAAFRRAAGVARFAYNWALSEYQRLKAGGDPVDWNELKKQFRASIDLEFPFVREVTKCAAEEGIADCRRAIATYYKAKAAQPRLRFPGFRKRRKKIGGFGLANDQFRVDGHTARLPKIGAVDLAEVLRFEGRILSGRVKECAGHWYLTVVVEVAAAPGDQPAAAVGIDFGLARFATLSTGEGVETQAHLRQSEAKLKRLQRGLARKKKGSQNREKWKRRVTRHHERVAHQRADFLHQFTTRLVREFGTICIEDLNLRGLCQTRLAKSFHDAGIGEAVRQLEYKQRWRGGRLIRVDRFFPSTKRCHVCRVTNGLLTLADRVWTCDGCGKRHDRDLNAALNLLLEGVDPSRPGSGYVGTLNPPVELATAGLAGNGEGKLWAMKQELDGAPFCTPER